MIHGIVTKGWGWEEIIHNGDGYCGKILSVIGGKFCSRHYHEKKHETFHVIEGKLFVEIGDAIGRIYVQGDTISLPPRTLHRFKSMSPLARFIEFSTEDDPADSIRVEPGCSQLEAA